MKFMDGVPQPANEGARVRGHQGAQELEGASSASPAVGAGIASVLASGVDVKTFVLDTNVLLHNPNAIFLLADNEIIIPFDVIEELDKFKTGNDDLGRNARTVIRHLDRLREQGKLADGVLVPETGGMVRVVLPQECPLS